MHCIASVMHAFSSACWVVILQFKNGWVRNKVASLVITTATQPKDASLATRPWNCWQFFLQRTMGKCCNLSHLHPRWESTTLDFRCTVKVSVWRGWGGWQLNKNGCMQDSQFMSRAIQASQGKRLLCQAWREVVAMESQRRAGTLTCFPVAHSLSDCKGAVQFHSQCQTSETRHLNASLHNHTRKQSWKWSETQCRVQYAISTSDMYSRIPISFD